MKILTFPSGSSIDVVGSDKPERLRGLPDVYIHGNSCDTVFLVEPATQAAVDWIELNVWSEASWLGSSLVVEHRFLVDLMCGMRDGGLVVERA